MNQYFMDSEYIASRILCSAEEKRACLPVAEGLLRLADTARCNGLLELEKAAASPDFNLPPLSRIAVNLIVNGTDPALVQEILENYILSSRLNNQEFLENMLVCRGALAIQNGENPGCIRELLSSLFGLDFAEEFRSHLASMDAAKCRTEDRLPKLYKHLEGFPKTKLLEFIPETLDNRGIQRLLREISLPDLEYAVLGSSNRVFSLFSRNLAEESREQLLEDLSQIRFSDPEVIAACQKRILRSLEMLYRQGEIALCRMEVKLLSQEEIEELLNSSGN